MNDEELSELLKLTFHSEDSPELTDAVVDAFLTTEAECSSEKTGRVRARFVQKVLFAVHCDPVRRIDRKWSFGRWIEATRESVRLTRSDVGEALRKDALFIERLESGEKLPWKYSPGDVAELVCLFRVHMDAVTQLINNSVAVSQASVGTVVARSRGGRMSSDRGDSTKRALDMFLAHHASPSKPDVDVTNWLDSLRETLRQRDANDLLE